MATYTYKGKKITGTSTSEKVFKKSGIKKAAVDDTYLNKQTGHVYQCTVKGGPKDAKWKYIRTDVIGVPKLTPTKLKCPVRGTISGGSGNRYMTATWSHPKDYNSSKNGRRAQSIKYQWTLDTPGKKNIPKAYTNADESLTTSTINLNNFVFNNNTTYNRNSFYPLNKKRYLYGVRFSIWYRNSKGSKKGVYATQYRKFNKPRKPTLSDMDFDTESGLCTITISTNAGDDYYERYDTRYRKTVFSTLSGRIVLDDTIDTTRTTETVTWDAQNYNNLADGDYYKISISAKARGYAGDSAKVEKDYYVAYPNKPVIMSHSVSAKASDGRLTVKFDNSKTTEHPVDGVRLQYLKNSTASKAEDIPAGADWQDFEVQDNGSCKFLSIPVETVISEDGKYTWVRVKTWQLYEAVLYRTSDPVFIEELFTPEPEEGTAADDYAEILSTSAGADGQSGNVVIGWDENGRDDSDGTEITWDVDENAWRSTEKPSEFEFDWDEGPITHGGKTYQSHATVTIKGLKEGQKYYVRARRYKDGERTTYSKYSSTGTIVPAEKPMAVTATCKDYVAIDKSLMIYWTFTGSALQKEWQVRSGEKIIKSNKGSIGSTELTAKELMAYATNGVVSLNVGVSTGSGFKYSAPCKVSIIQKPVVDINVEPTLAEQPLEFTATANTQCDLIVIVYSQGVTSMLPTGTTTQTSGDTIYSGVESPAWSGTPLAATVKLPKGQDFWDGGDYRVSVVGVDRKTGMKSDEVIKDFHVTWEHQAPTIGDAVTITPLISIEDDGDRRIEAQIDLTPPTGSIDTDVYDIYRLVGGKAYQINDIGFPLTFTAVDEFAPFGEDRTLYYRIAIRTEDGDISFSDYEYVQDLEFMRFDWEGNYLELPYGLGIGEQYRKDVDIRAHMDGEHSAYWNNSVDHTASLSSSVIELVQPEEITKAREMARFTNAVFVRLPNGQAFEADVQVTDLSVKNKEVVAIAIDATEIGLTDEFMLPTPYEIREEE